jgi:hypothetical protein
MLKPVQAMKYFIDPYRVTLPLIFVFLLFVPAAAQKKMATDTNMIFTPSNPNLIRPQNYRPYTHAWGMDLLLSNNGFGLGFFYRNETTDELSWMVNFAISDVKDDAEVDQYDYYGQSFVPGKKNRLLLFPLTASIHYRLFKDDIVDNFRPFITAGLGPTMVLVSPYLTDQLDMYGQPVKMDFFTSLKYAKPRYTVGGFIGVGVNFGMEKGTITGLSIKYFLAPFPDGIEVMQGGYIKNFGGLFINLTFGAMY